MALVFGCSGERPSLIADARPDILTGDVPANPDGVTPDTADAGFDVVAPRDVMQFDVQVVNDVLDPDVQADAREGGDVVFGPEICDNGLDDNGNGSVDEGCQCLIGETQRCYGGPRRAAGVGICTFGMQTCMGSGGEFGLWAACTGWVPPAGEMCDMLDNDCDGMPDNGCDCHAGDMRGCYTGVPATRGIGPCHDGTQTCATGAGGIGATWGTCTGEVTPAPELCDGLDNDCSGAPDEGCACTPGMSRMCYGGPSGTAGVGACHPGVQNCVMMGALTGWGACTMQILPSGEACDRVDNNCNNMVDEGCECMPGETRPCYDGPMGTQGVGICTAGTQTCVAGGAGVGSTWGTCASSVRPQPERCDDLDNNCNAMVDEGCTCRRGETRPCYTGPAGTQGVGACTAGSELCAVSGGMADWSGTCGMQVLPVAEICDRIDNDCNGVVDDHCECLPGESRACFTSTSGMAGVGICAAGTQMCVPSPTGMGSVWGRCAGEIGPAPELCDMIDNDCDGNVDNGCACTPGTMRPCYTGPPATRDIGICAAGFESCQSGAMGVGSAWGTCDMQVLPRAEVCNFMDDDCNGMDDDGIRCGPVVTCPGPQSAIAGTFVSLTGTISGASSFGWSVAGGPAGAYYNFTTPTMPATQFTSTIVGVYTVRLTATDSMGRRNSCDTQVTMLGRGLRVELQWDQATDMDIHVHNNIATRWAAAPNDCNYFNPGPDWDFPGVSSDDPRLDVDVIPGYGPENIRIDIPNTSETYTLGVHYYNGAVASTATVRVYCGNSLMLTQMRSLAPHPSASAAGDFWRIARINFSDPDTCAITNVSQVFTYAEATTVGGPAL